MASEFQGYSLSDISSLGNMVMKIVANMINNTVNAPFLARVISVTGNKVTVQSMKIDVNMTFPEVAKPVTYYNMLIGMPLTGKVAITWPILPGDVGLCIPTDYDITLYKNTGMESTPQSGGR